MKRILLAGTETQLRIQLICGKASLLHITSRHHQCVLLQLISEDCCSVLHNCRRLASSIAQTKRLQSRWEGESETIHLTPAFHSNSAASLQCFSASLSFYLFSVSVCHQKLNALAVLGLKWFNASLLRWEIMVLLCASSSSQPCVELHGEWCKMV